MSSRREQEIADKINNAANKIDNVNDKINNVNDKLENVRVNRVKKNIEQWEAVGRKVPLLKGFANFMVKVNKKQLK